MDTVAAARVEQWCNQTDHVVAECSAMVSHVEASGLETAMIALLKRISGEHVEDDGPGEPIEWSPI